MKTPAFPSFTIASCPRWVREAVRTEARRTGESLGAIIARCVGESLDPTLVKVAKHRAQVKILGRNAEFSDPHASGLLAPLPPARERAGFTMQDAMIIELEDDGLTERAPRQPGPWLAPDED